MHPSSFLTKETPQTLGISGASELSHQFWRPTAKLRTSACIKSVLLVAGLTAPVMRGLDQSADLLSQLDSSVVGTSSSSANSISQSESSTAVDSNSRGSTNSSGSGSGSEQAEAGVEDVSLWVPAQRCSLLHANVIRYKFFWLQSLQNCILVWRGSPE